MNETETAALLAVAALYDNRSITEETAIAWHAAIGDLDLDEAKDALVTHYATSTAWLMPAHLRAIVEQRRERERQEAHRRELFERRDQLALVSGGVAPGRYGQRAISEPSPWYVQARETLALLRAQRQTAAQPSETDLGGSL